MIDSTLYHIDPAGDVRHKPTVSWVVIDDVYYFDSYDPALGWMYHGHVVRHSQTKIFMLYHEGI